MTKWIQKTGMKKGALSRQLGIPIHENIPITLLRKIKNANIGDTITNPTKKGRKKYKVTKLLKQRAVMAFNLKQIRH